MLTNFYKYFIQVIITEAIMQFIFAAGAPGSKWSSVCKNIYASPSINTSDHTNERQYWHDASGTSNLMHSGAYWDPGMEFGRGFDNIDHLSKTEAEDEFIAPFASFEGTAIIKSHVFCNHLNHLSKTWLDVPIVLIHRPDDACLGWWVKCGHFDITYPLYHEYYKNLRTMATIIKKQNEDLSKFIANNNCMQYTTNQELCNDLGLLAPPQVQNYVNDNINVYLYKN